MKNNSFFFGFILLNLLFALKGKAQHIEISQQGQPTSIRGLSVVDDSVAWVSGSKGYVATTTNGGKTWTWQQVKGFEKADFRDIEAFSATEAIIMSSGTPALILKTTDGGLNWKVKYRNTDTAYFFDAMDFADSEHQHGFILGDPIMGKFVLMKTLDGGETWAMFEKRPDALPAEAAFAASGTCLRVNQGVMEIVTGGTSSRLISLRLINKQAKDFRWWYSNLSILHNNASQGAFSLADGAACTVVVGGDYKNDHRADSVAEYLCYDGRAERKFRLCKKAPCGFQSCVEFIQNDTFLSTGTPGSNISTDGGNTWAQIDSTSFNVCRKAERGNLVIFAGDGGKIGIYKP